MIKEATLQWFSNVPGDATTTDTSSGENYFIARWDTWLKPGTMTASGKTYRKQKDSRDDLIRIANLMSCRLGDMHECLKKKKAVWQRWLKQWSGWADNDLKADREDKGQPQSQKPVPPFWNKLSQHHWELGPISIPAHTLQVFLTSRCDRGFGNSHADCTGANFTLSDTFCFWV